MKADVAVNVNDGIEMVDSFVSSLTPTDAHINFAVGLPIPKI